MDARFNLIEENDDVVLCLEVRERKREPYRLIGRDQAE
jgi:hypothetical protein